MCVDDILCLLYGNRWTPFQREITVSLLAALFFGLLPLALVILFNDEENLREEHGNRDKRSRRGSLSHERIVEQTDNLRDPERFEWEQYGYAEDLLQPISSTEGSQSSSHSDVGPSRHPRLSFARSDLLQASHFSEEESVRSSADSGVRRQSSVSQLGQFSPKQGQSLSNRSKSNFRKDSLPDSSSEHSRPIHAKPSKVLWSDTAFIPKPNQNVRDPSKDLGMGSQSQEVEEQSVNYSNSSPPGGQDLLERIEAPLTLTRKSKSSRHSGVRFTQYPEKKVTFAHLVHETDSSHHQGECKKKTCLGNEDVSQATRPLIAELSIESQQRINHNVGSEHPTELEVLYLESEKSPAKQKQISVVENTLRCKLAKKGHFDCLEGGNSGLETIFHDKELIRIAKNSIHAENASRDTVDAVDAKQDEVIHETSIGLVVPQEQIKPCNLAVSESCLVNTEYLTNTFSGNFPERVKETWIAACKGAPSFLLSKQSEEGPARLNSDNNRRINSVEHTKHPPLPGNSIEQNLTSSKREPKQVELRGSTREQIKGYSASSKSLWEALTVDKDSRTSYLKGDLSVIIIEGKEKGPGRQEKERNENTVSSNSFKNFNQSPVKKGLNQSDSQTFSTSNTDIASSGDLTKIQRDRQSFDGDSLEVCNQPQGPVESDSSQLLEKCPRHASLEINLSDQPSKHNVSPVNQSHQESGVKPPVINKKGSEIECQTYQQETVSSKILQEQLAPFSIKNATRVSREGSDGCFIKEYNEGQDLHCIPLKNKDPFNNIFPNTDGLSDTSLETDTGTSDFGIDEEIDLALRIKTKNTIVPQPPIDSPSDTPRKPLDPLSSSRTGSQISVGIFGEEETLPVSKEAQQGERKDYEGKEVEKEEESAQEEVDILRTLLLASLPSDEEKEDRIEFFHNDSVFYKAAPDPSNSTNIDPKQDGIDGTSVVLPNTAGINLSEEASGFGVQQEPTQCLSLLEFSNKWSDSSSNYEWSDGLSSCDSATVLEALIKPSTHMVVDTQSLSCSLSPKQSSDDYRSSQSDRVQAKAVNVYSDDAGILPTSSNTDRKTCILSDTQMRLTGIEISNADERKYTLLPITLVENKQNSVTPVEENRQQKLCTWFDISKAQPK